tara:strand:+ start:3430 stop:6117 length:2688 start_codon:yes stop_codon:yes gene_type:complete
MSDELSKLYNQIQEIKNSPESWIVRNNVTGIVHEGVGRKPLAWGEYPEGMDPESENAKQYDMWRGNFLSLSQDAFTPEGMSEIQKQDQDSVTSDPLWATASRVLHNYLNPTGEDKGFFSDLSGDKQRQLNQGEQIVSDEKGFDDYAQWGVNFISLFENNFSAMGINTAQLMDAPIEVHRAMYYLMESADRKGVKFSNVVKGLGNMMADPFTYLGLGTLGIGLLGKQTGQKLTKMAFKDLLKNSVKLVKPTKVSAVASAEGALYMSAFDLARQNVAVNAEVQDSINKTQLATMGTTGAVMGQGLTRLVDAAPQIATNVSGAITDAGEAAKARMAEGGTQLNTGLDIDPLLAAAGDLVSGNNKAPGPEIDYEGFTSQALEVTKTLNQQKGTGQQFKSQLLKGGVKQDEIDWLGLDDILNKDKVTRDEVEQHIRDNRIEIDNVTLTGEPEDQVIDFEEPEILTPDEVYGPEYGSEQMFEQYLDGGATFDEIKQSISDTGFDEATKAKTIARAQEVYHSDGILNLHAQFEPDETAVLEEAGNRLYNEIYYENKEMQFIRKVDRKHGYAITGNDDLGYMVFTDVAQSKDYKNGLLDEPVFSLDEAQLQLEDIKRENGLLIEDHETTRHSEHTQPGGENYQEVLLRLPNDGIDSLAHKRDIDYSGDHFDELNIIAHMRLKDRKTNAGEKVLYVEEIQSDWGQQGRNNFRLDNKELEELAEKRKKAQIIYDKYAKQRKETGKDIEGTELDEANAAISFLQQTSNTELLNINLIPKAPFVTDTDKWTQLALKKLLVKATEEGDYDYIAISPGRVQFERWNNEGLRNYYDKIIPKNAQKIVKKLDKDALGDVQIEMLSDLYSQKSFAIKLTDKLKEKVRNGQALFSVPAAVAAGAIGLGEDDGN